MRASSFAEYASLPDLTADETYTVELLIEIVRDKFDPTYWDNWSDRGEAREAPDYRPTFSRDHIQPAAAELMTLSWVSFQRLGDAERPVRDLSALRFLPEMSSLVLIDSEVSDLTRLLDCKKLRKLHLQQNPIRDISPLAGCVNLEELELGNTPIEDFSVLQTLPSLRTLSISKEQLSVFKNLERLPALEKLELGLDTFNSFDGFPLMPQLRVIQGAHVLSLSGLERFPMLENLVNFSGTFDSLEPLRELKYLTHVNILNSRVRSLESLSGLLALRECRLSTAAKKLDLSPLQALPALHEITVKCKEKEPASLANVRSELSSWDVEFRAKTARHPPSLELEVVDLETFEFYDKRKPFGLSETDRNEGMLSSELDWLDRHLEQVLAVDFNEDDDYKIPFNWNGARSRTIVLYSRKAIQAFPRIVSRIQNVLSMAKKDWIIYLQSDDAEPEFTVWVYPQKIMVTRECADTVRTLIKKHQQKSK